MSLPAYRSAPLLAFCLFACSDSTTPAPALDDAAIAGIAEFLVAGLASMPSGNASSPAIGGNGSLVANLQFPVANTLPCPAGGTTVVTGSLDRTPNQSTRITSVTWDAAAVQHDCAFSKDGRTWTFTSGTVNATGNATFAFPAQPGGDPSMLTASLSRSGSLTIFNGSQSRVCSVSLATTYNASASTFSTTGTVCERQISNNATPRGGLGG